MTDSLEDFFAKHFPRPQLNEADRKLLEEFLQPISPEEAGKLAKELQQLLAKVEEDAKSRRTGLGENFRGFPTSIPHQKAQTRRGGLETRRRAPSLNNAVSVVKRVNGMAEARLNEFQTSCVTKNFRGRPSKPFKSQRRVHLSLRLTWSEYAKVQSEAKQAGLTLSEFVRLKLFQEVKG